MILPSDPKSTTYESKLLDSMCFKNKINHRLLIDRFNWVLNIYYASHNMNSGKNKSQNYNHFRKLSLIK